MISSFQNVESVPPDNGIGGSDTDSNGDDNNHSEVYIMNTKPEERSTSFFAQPGILAGQFTCFIFINYIFIVFVTVFNLKVICFIQSAYHKFWHKFMILESNI